MLQNSLMIININTKSPKNQFEFNFNKRFEHIRIHPVLNNFIAEIYSRLHQLFPK